MSKNEIISVMPVVIKQNAVIDYSGIGTIIDSVKRKVDELDLDNLLNFDLDKMDDKQFQVFVKDNLPKLKTIRADLRKEAGDYENARKTFKKIIEQPYNDFMVEYKKITKLMSDADVRLREGVKKIEDAEKEIIERKVIRYFDEVKAITLEELKDFEYNLDFIKYNKLNINITKSLTDARFRKEVDDFFEKIKNDLAVIGTHEHGRRVFVKYVNNLDLADSLREVQADVIKEQELLNQKPIEKPTENEKVEVKEVPKVDEFIKVVFEIEDTKENIIKVREFMKANGINYKGIA